MSEAGEAQLLMLKPSRRKWGDIIIMAVGLRGIAAAAYATIRMKFVVKHVSFNCIYTVVWVKG